MMTEKTELKEQEYFELFTAVFHSTAKWATADLKRVATRMRGVVYRLALTSPEVFESLWTKTGRLNIIEETKAWKAANRLVGSNWKLQNRQPQSNSHSQRLRQRRRHRFRKIPPNSPPKQQLIPISSNSKLGRRKCQN